MQVSVGEDQTEFTGWKNRCLDLCGLQIIKTVPRNEVVSILKWKSSFREVG